MIQISMIKDIRKYEVKTMGPFTTRQVISLVVCASYAIPLVLLIPGDLFTRAIIGIVAVLPAFIFGKKTITGGLPFEKLLLRLIYKSFLTPAKRKVKIHSVYTDIRDELNKEEEKAFYESLSSKEKKKYEKNKGKITYNDEKIYL